MPQLSSLSKLECEINDIQVFIECVGVAVYLTLTSTSLQYQFVSWPCHIIVFYCRAETP